MDTKNVIAAISLSAAVIILYSLFFAPPPVTKEQLAEKNKTEQNTDAPSLDQKENLLKLQEKRL
jgi:YidC/Oxa1 family membrane protein insertase